MNTSSVTTDLAVLDRIIARADRTEELGTVFSSHPNPMWAFDQETLRFLEVNASAIRLYGYSREEFLRMTILDIHSLEDIRALVREVLHPHLKGTSLRKSWTHRRKDSMVFTVEIISGELTLNGRPAELVAVVARTEPGAEPAGCSEMLREAVGFPPVSDDLPASAVPTLSPAA